HGMRPQDPERAGQAGVTRGLLMLLAPLAGVSELLRQAYDELFNKHDVVPIYFALPQTETTAVSAAIEFLKTFLLQYIAYRRDEPSLCRLSLTLNDLVRSEEHTSELQSLAYLVCRLLLEKKN